MASIIFLGCLFGKQTHIGKECMAACYVNKSLLNDGLIAIIAKGNRLAGIKAKE